MYINFGLLNEKKFFLRMNGLTRKSISTDVGNNKVSASRIRDFIMNDDSVINDVIPSIKKRTTLGAKNIKIKLIDLLGQPIMILFEFINETELIQIISNIISKDPSQNSDNLLTNFKEWCEDIINGKQFRHFHEEFLFKASLMVSLLDRIIKIDEIIIQQINDIIETSKIEHKRNPQCPIIEIPESGVMFEAISVQELLMYIPTILNTINILQDRFFQLIGKALGKNNIPNKIGDISNQIAKSFGSNILNLLRNYRKDNGKEIRNYRNLDQHEFSLINNYIVDKDTLFHIYLPDDPFVNTFQKITFSQKIDAIPLIEVSIEKFHNFVDNVLKEIGCAEISHKHGSTTSSFSPPPTNGCISLIQKRDKVLCMYLKDGALTSNELPFKMSNITITPK